MILLDTDIFIDILRGYAPTGKQLVGFWAGIKRVRQLPQ